MITVSIPVGPEQHHRAYLDECLASLAAQTHLPDEVLVIDDMAGLPQGLNRQYPFPARTWHAPWRLGVAGAFNMGVALAENDLVFLLGADDRLLPNCLERCLEKYGWNDERPAYYGVGVRYSDGRPDQFELCNAAMVTKGLWRATGGFPPEAGSGAPDAAFISMLMVNSPHSLILVSQEEPLYWYRVHNGTDTAGRGPWQGVILETRNLLTQLWQPPAWGRYK